MLTKKPIKKTNLNFKIFLTSLFLILFFSLSISAIATAATCGDGIFEFDSGEECELNLPISPPVCGGGACDPVTCKCSSYGTTTTPTPTGSASFSANKTSGTTPLTVNFTLTNGTNCINYLCDTGVGTQAYVYEKSFSCAYVSAGSFTASISCNGNVLKKIITVTGTGATATPTPTITPTPTVPKPRPLEYLTIHAPYSRAVENSGQKIGGKDTYSFANTKESHIGYTPYFRVFIPPGTVSMDLLIQDGYREHKAVAQYKIPPTGSPQEPTEGYDFGTKYRIKEFEAHQRWITNTGEGNLYIANDAFYPEYLPVSGGGWLYVNVYGMESVPYYTNFTVQVDTKTYNAWWDKYIKDEAGWNTYIENVETYIDPTIETKTPTCKANFSKTDITAPGESKLSFSSENTTKLIGSCTGPWPIEELDLPLSYTDYAFPFTINQTGTETCTFTPYNGTTKGESCSATVTVKKSTASTPTPTPSPVKPKPADYVDLHKPYTRAPDNVEYYSFAVGGDHSDNVSYVFVPRYRVFIPPGVVMMNSSMQEWHEILKINAVARHNKIPSAEPVPGGFGEYCTLSELAANDCFTGLNVNSDFLNVARDSFSPPLEKNRAGWLYVKISSETADPSYIDNHFSVRVDTKTYNAWWDKYIKDEAGWNKYIENVETYIDPTTEIQTSPTPTPAPTSTTSPTSPTSTLKACQRDNPDCEKLTCNNVYCFDGCERIKGTRVCDGK